MFVHVFSFLLCYFCHSLNMVTHRLYTNKHTPNTHTHTPQHAHTNSRLFSFLALISYRWNLCVLFFSANAILLKNQRKKKQQRILSFFSSTAYRFASHIHWQVIERFLLLFFRFFLLWQYYFVRSPMCVIPNPIKCDNISHLEVKKRKKNK